MTATDTIREIAAGAEDAARNCPVMAIASQHIVEALCDKLDVATVVGQAQAFVSLNWAVAEFIKARYDTADTRCAALNLAIAQITHAVCG